MMAERSSWQLAHLRLPSVDQRFVRCIIDAPSSISIQCLSRSHERMDRMCAQIRNKNLPIIVALCLHSIPIGIGSRST